VSGVELNGLLDRLPRTRFGSGSREVPAFRTCGVVGFYLAVLVAMGGGLLAGVSLLVMSFVALVCAASFYVYVYLRRWITGRESLELLDQVWFAEICTAGALLALGVPVLQYLDVLAVALCPFLAAGRVGCTLVGCCHGQPSPVGFVYGEEHALDGFPRHLVGVRLFPVPAIEAAGLTAIGVVGLIALPFAPAGFVFAWFLIAYAVLRFGLEWLRGDVRPEWLGFSKPQWMALAEFGLGIWIVEGSAVTVGALNAALVGLLVATVIAVLAARHSFDPRRRLLAPDHLGELREAARRPVGGNGSGPRTVFRSATSLGVNIGVSPAAAALDQALHVSLSLPEGRRDLPLLCALAAGAFPWLWPDSGRVSSAGVLHVHVPVHSAPEADRGTSEEVGRDLFGTVARSLQAASGTVEPTPPSVDPGARRNYFDGHPPYAGRSFGRR
jgi:prolipoprotein diacylglyceryltransferase